MFPKLKVTLEASHFESLQGIQSTVTTELKELSGNDLQERS
jgi:hypothetical protein